MKIFKLFILNIFSLVTVLGCSDKTELIEETVILDPTLVYNEQNIVYGDNAKQTFDLHLPANRTAETKVVILIHGGGWIGGDKTEMNDLKSQVIIDFPDVAVVNMNYRLADANTLAYPMQIEDISAVVDYLKLNETKYTISEQLGFIGTSAGGHLALLWAYSFDTLKNTTMVCSIVGPTNLADPAYLNNTDPTLQTMLDAFGTHADLDFLKEVSPYYQATTTSPPTILFYGGEDPLIPVSQGIDLRDKLSSLSVTHQFTLYPYAAHGWIGFDLLDTWLKLKAFMEKHL